MSDFCIKKRAGIDVLVFADGACRPASQQESWLYAENKRLRARLEARIKELEGLLRETVPWLEDFVELGGGHEPEILIGIRAALKGDRR